MSNEILVQQDGPILRVTLNRPDAGNGVSDDMAAGLAGILDRAADTSQCVVLRGAGPDFCTGRAHNRGGAPEGPPEALALRRRNEVVFNCYGAFRRAPIPIVVVAGAGVVETIRGASEKIGAILPSKPTPLDNIQQAIERANKDYYERFIVPLRDPDAGYELLIAIQHESEGCRLLKCQQNSTRIVDDSAMLGTGGLTAQPYSDLWWPDISLLEAEIMACCLVRYAKDYDELCGGETRVFTLTPDGLFRLDDAYIRQADDYFLNFHRFAVKMLLPFDSLKADSDFFEGQLSSLVKDLKRYREILAREHQRAHYKIP